MARRNLYETLGVPRTASEAEIRKAYRKAAREFHPDRNPGNREAEERFKDVSFAKEVLLNREKRELYDEFGEPGLREGFDAASYREYNAARRRGAQGVGGRGWNASVEDLFRSAGAQARERGRDVRNGGGRPGSFQDFVRGDVVDSIFGRGRDRKRKRDLISEIGVGFMEAIRGSEKEISFQAPDGKERVLRARIPAGVGDGERVRLRGQGADGGDLVLTVRVDAHPVFTRDGRDLLFTLPITIGEAYHGAKIPVPTPGGDVQLSIPAGVRSGAKLRLRGRGVQRGDEVGDLIATVEIRLPEQQEGAADVIDELEQLYREDPRGELHLEE